MKVMLVSHSSAVDNFGGAELTLLQILDQWRALRPDVEFFVVARTPEGLLQAEFESRGLTHRAIDFDSWVLPLVRERPIDVIMTARMDSHAVSQIAEWIREFGPDLVVTNTIVSPWGALAAGLEGVPHAWMVHEFGDLDHGLGFRIGRSETFEDIDLLSSLVVANSEAVRDHIAQWVNPEKLTIAYPAMDLERARELARAAGPSSSDPGQGGSTLRTVMVGRLYESKGQWRLLKAIAALKQQGIHASATLVGRADPAELATTQDLIDSLGIDDHVTIVDETRNPFAYVAAADVAVMASNCEAFGRVTVEYLALGKPVIAARSGANPELVTDGETGWLFDPDDIDSLVASLREAARNPDEVASRGAAARRSVDDHIALAYPMSDLVERFETVAAQGPHRLAKLPHITREWLELPQFVEDYLREMNAIRIAAHASATWKVGRLLTSPLRMMSRALGRRSIT